MSDEDTYVNGKLQEGASLCQTCAHAQIVQGYAESERRIWCTYGRWDHPEPIRFAVKECTEYLGREQTSLRQMEKMAWILLSKKGGRPPGFVTPEEAQQIEFEDVDA